MTTIQNVACLELEITPDEKRVSFTKDIFKYKKILGIYMFRSDDVAQMLNPSFTGEINNNADFGDISLYLNLTDIENNQFVKDLSLSQFILSNNKDTSPEKIFLESKINRVLNFDQSFLVLKTFNFTKFKTLIYVLYQSQNFTPQDDTVNGSITITINGEMYNDNKDVQLSKFVNKELNGKKIKQIISTGNQDGYLDLICKNHIIENVPIGIFDIRNEKQFLLDNVEIDFEKSFYRKRNFQHFNPHASTTYLTFIY
jgi:hypothetical protein